MPQKTNFICGEQNQNSDDLWGAGVKTDWEEAWRNFLGDGNSLYPDW